MAIENEKILALSREFQLFHLKAQTLNPNITAVESYIGWSTGKIARLELIIELILKSDDKLKAKFGL